MAERLSIAVRRLPNAVALPSYAHPGDAGADLVAAEDVVLAPGQRAAVATGISLAIPNGYVGLVHPRSGLALRHGLGLVNSPGTIDAGFRGELKVLLINTDPQEPIELHRGDRIAQLVIQPVVTADFVEVESLDDSVRATGGFGSTGGWTHHGEHAASGEPTAADRASEPGHSPAGG